MFTTHTLPNGVRIVLAPSAETKAACVYALFPVGSRHETLAQNGASHFVEHMMFKGTRERPTTLHITRDLDRIGAEYNAFTGKEYTGYYIKANGEHLDLALDMLSDMLFRSTYKQEEFVRERKVILEEISMYEDSPSQHLDDLFEELLYRGHPIGRIISGTRETMLGITHDALVRYRDRHYHPAKMVLVLAGSIGDDAVARASVAFGRISVRKRVCPTAAPFRNRPRGPIVHVHRKETAQAHLAVGVPTFRAEDPRTDALLLLANILGGTMSSRLFVAVRERHGLAYAVHASADAYTDTGSFTVMAGLDPSRIEQALRVILRELGRVREHGVTAEELARAKDNIEGRMILGFEDSCSRAEWYGKQVLLRTRTRTPEQKMQEVAQVTRAQVQQVAQDILRSDRLHMALIGDFADAGRFKKLLSL
ncbi:MAG: pitrilysin family protein [bacterium]|nr:pitrilysin family protein [bacterium]